METIEGVSTAELEQLGNGSVILLGDGTPAIKDDTAGWGDGPWFSAGSEMPSATEGLCDYGPVVVLVRK